MSRYRLDPEVGVIHDTGCACDRRAQAVDLVPGGYLLLRKWLAARSMLCPWCFGEDTAEAASDWQANTHENHLGTVRSHDIVEST